MMNNLIYAARTYLGGRRGLILLAVAVLGVGAMLNWGWLVAVGVAPLLLALAPCAAMCALGLCMNKAGASPAHPAPGPGRRDPAPRKARMAVRRAGAPR
jgi:hypothetical protein